MKKRQAVVLVIDDDPDILDSLKANLELPEIDLNVITAENGLNGLLVAKNAHPDVIVLDFQLPDINGFDFMEELRSDQSLSDIKVIMLTAQDTGRNRWESIDIEMDDFMGKPFDLAELEARIYQMLQ